MPDSTRPERPINDSYWKGRQFPPRKGSKRAQIQPKRTTSGAAANLIPKKMLTPVSAGTVSTNTQEGQLETIELLREFESFKESLLPSAQADVSNGMAAEAILKKYQAIAAGRLVSLIPSMNQKVALAAAQQILDRTMGKAIERKAIRHQFEDVADKDLDSLIVSMMKETEDGEK